MTGRVGAIALNTFREAIRSKVLHSLLFFAALIIVSALAFGQLSLHEEARLTRDLGLGGISLFSVVIAIVIGVSLLYQELERKTIYNVLSKPIARWQFVLGKFAGIALVLFVALVGMTAVLCGVLGVQGDAPDAALAKAVVLTFAEVVVVAAVALLFSSFSTPFLSGLFTLGLFVVGRALPDLRALADRVGPAAGRVVRSVAAVLPDLALYQVSGHEVEGLRVSVHAQFVDWGYVAWAAGYGVGYAAAVLLLAMALFRRRDFL